MTLNIISGGKKVNFLRDKSFSLSICKSQVFLLSSSHRNWKHFHLWGCLVSLGTTTAAEQHKHHLEKQTRQGDRQSSFFNLFFVVVVVDRKICLKNFNFDDNSVRQYNWCVKNQSKREKSLSSLPLPLLTFSLLIFTSSSSSHSFLSQNLFLWEKWEGVNCQRNESNRDVTLMVTFLGRTLFLGFRLSTPFSFSALPLSSFFFPSSSSCSSSSLFSLLSWHKRIVVWGLLPLDFQGKKEENPCRAFTIQYKRHNTKGVAVWEQRENEHIQFLNKLLLLTQ